MAGLSLYPDSTAPGRGDGGAPGGPLSAAQPPAAGTSSAAHLEPVLRSLFDQATSPTSSSSSSSPSPAGRAGGGGGDGDGGGGAMSGGLGIKLVPGPSPTLISVEFSDVLSSWIRDLSGSAQTEVEGLVCRLLNERVAKARAAGGGSLHEMLAWVKAVALAPGDPVTAGLQSRWKWADQVMRARGVVFLPPDQATDTADEFPYNSTKPGARKKHRNGVPDVPGDSFFESSERLGKRHCSDSHLNYPNNTTGCSNQPRRRSGRFLGMLKLGDNYLPRKRVPVGPFFQADVPEWTGPAKKRLVPDNGKYADDSKWLGTLLWPLQGCENGSVPEPDDGEALSAKDRVGESDLCMCRNPRSAECNQYHIRMRKFWLRSELGQAFFSMGFDSMGEDVSHTWSKEQQSGFDTLVRLNPISEGETFWYDALSRFPRKTCRDIASYYFNVHVLRRMSLQSRSCKNIDSDDDEWNLQQNGNSSASLKR